MRNQKPSNTIAGTSMISNQKIGMSVSTRDYG
jgi:hypothetical protein